MKTLPRIARLQRTSLDRPRHSWVQRIDHVKHCAWCEMTTTNKPVSGGSAWFQTLEWPNNPTTYNNLEGGPVAACRGPRPQRLRLLAAIEAGNVTPVSGESEEPDFFVGGREPFDVTAQVGRAKRDDLVRLVGEELPVPELTDRGEQWLRLARVSTAAVRVAA